ncbi:uncharacterized protein VTP21DRAFT_1289 [Calcarisporiella thermophila]|uniref:uncharacterized protein n=1 Tax=Calcarisporiella thermophila TaxID=911321 RepID=UPI00374234B5
MAYQNDRLYIRQANDTACKDLATDIFCFPKENDTWEADKFNQFVWNNRNPWISHALQVKIQLLSADTFKLVKDWDTSNNGTLDVHVSSDWVPVIRPNVSATRKFVWRLSIPDLDSQHQLDNGPTFFISNTLQQPVTKVLITSVHIPVTVTVSNSQQPTITVTESPSSNNSSNNTSNNSESRTAAKNDVLEPWMVGTIAGAAACLIATLVVIILLLRRIRRDRHLSLSSDISGAPRGLSQGYLLHEDSDYSPISKSTGNGYSFDGRTDAVFNVPGKQHGDGLEDRADDLATPNRVLSALDARLIAEAFRQQMRRPTWEDKEKCDVEEDNDAFGMDEQKRDEQPVENVGNRELWRTD